MFRGLFEHALDPKGRVSIPAHFRDVLVNLEERCLIITANPDRYLVAYPTAQWNQLEQKVRSQSQFDPHVEAFKRLYVASAMECPLDKQGRILLPPLLRERGGIGRDIVFAGMGETIEIWDKALWYQVVDKDRPNWLAIKQTMANLGV
ncbi:MAG: division/cell wall cluster transcriptional repressor MraZ [Deltaproteobacteria bacterium]|nr:division/cell wall cluster transcriptional repressor MraZ [Deltaproteobacteria bacterium]